MKKFILTFLTLAATAVGAAAQDAVTIEMTGNDQMQYDKKEITAVEGQKVTIKFKHIGKLPKAAMGHNVVILKSGTQIAPFAMKCAPAAANDYIPEDEESKSLIIAHTEMIGGGEETEVTFTAPAAGEYPYLCTFPGHFGVMNGKFIVTAK
ncbi:plastocyanin/azurin family copper-binding protein [Haloferula sp. A504]|uniref:plastocyanin/azurin family copper-binding protein n=1 Tax=Haloferula sp. A504 TaxID=3373601 RepID=UPI0031C41A56|nr:azurin [Verrucomicrobiaceae bacterium E54]